MKDEREVTKDEADLVGRKVTLALALMGSVQRPRGIQPRTLECPECGRRGVVFSTGATYCKDGHPMRRMREVSADGGQR